MGTGMSRRGFFAGAAAAGLSGVGASTVQAHGNGHAPARPTGRLPGRGELTVRGAYVMTMDPKLGDIPGGDVHVRNGRIVAVGKGLNGGGRSVDGRHRVVMPGLVDTHWHMWTTLYRSLAGAASNPANGYFALNLRNGAVTTPGDIYQGVRLSLADAVFSGTTTVHDWAHNIRGPEYADANLRAHAESGLRGRFSYGTPQGHPADRTIDLEDLERVNREWFATRRAGNHAPRPGRPAARHGGARGLPRRVRQGARAGPAGQLPRQLQPRPGRPGDGPPARGGGDARPGHADHPRAVHRARRARRARLDAHAGQREPVVGAARSATA